MTQTDTPSHPSSGTQPTLPPLRPLPRLGLGAVLIGKEEEALALEVLRSRELFRYHYSLPVEEQGKMAGTLEKEFCELIGTRHALAVTSGTAALEVALGALGVGPGDEVIVPVWSWISCFTAIVRLGARPVLAEIDESLGLAPGEVTRLATPRTRAVMVIHYQGAAVDMDPILEEAAALGIPVLEDCAESTGATYKGRRVGSLGAIGIFSFQYQKMITSGEGGMVVTSDPKLYERAVRFHDIGSVRPYHLQWITPQEPNFCGSQFRMNELTAAVALAQFRKLEATRRHCQALAGVIRREIEKLPGLQMRLLADPEGDNGIELYFFLETPELAARFNEALSARNIHIARMTGTYCHVAREYCRLGLAHAPGASPFAGMEPWPAPGYREGDFPRTDRVVERFISLPLGVLFTQEDACYIAETIKALHAEIVAPTLAGK
ncbi:MAG TPA: DegT/DnrJ/EryC1/StrS family aminotransferase [Chthoniobacteraceae bacterium]|nr:DegT/DnrJ/EryC1/StrS family aminotransferase [Chthoniobacteraceae bacterium]